MRSDIKIIHKIIQRPHLIVERLDDEGISFLGNRLLDDEARHSEMINEIVRQNSLADAAYLILASHKGN